MASRALTRGRRQALRKSGTKKTRKKQNLTKKRAALLLRKAEKVARRLAVARAMNFPLPEGYDFSKRRILT